MEIGEIEKRCVSVIRRHLPQEGWRILLFGSQASGGATETSDIDIAIAGDGPAPWERMAVLRREIRELPTLRSVDIVDLGSVDEDFRRSVLASGKVLA